MWAGVHWVSSVHLGVVCTAELFQRGGVHWVGISAGGVCVQCGSVVVKVRYVVYM